MEQQAHSGHELCSLRAAGILKAAGWEKNCEVLPEHVQVSFAGSRVTICVSAVLPPESPAFVHTQDDGVINIQLHTLISHPHLHLPMWTLVGIWLRRGKYFPATHMNGYLAASVTTKLAVHPWCDSLLGCLMSAFEIQSSSSVGQDPTGAIESGFLVLSGPLCEIRRTICHPSGWQCHQNSKKPGNCLTPIGRKFPCAVKVAVYL
jgi:hypothetical protein